MTDKRQAIIDAINAIKDSRAIGKGIQEPLPTGSIDLDIDPQLNKPKTSPSIDPRQHQQNVKIEDPDEVLKQQQENQQQDYDQTKSGEKDDQSSTEADPTQPKDKGDESDQTTETDSQEDQSTEDTSSKTKNDTTEGGSSSEISPDYARAWNEIMDRFDTDEVSEQQLEQIIDAIKAGRIDRI